MKPYLLDTHALLWFLAGDNSLSKKAKNVIIDSTNPCSISIATLWEISIKMKLGKLKIDSPFEDLAEILANNDIDILQISFEHII